MWKILKETGNRFLMIVYPFNDKNVTFGFNTSKRDLYELYLILHNIFENEVQIEVTDDRKGEEEAHKLYKQSYEEKTTEEKDRIVLDKIEVEQKIEENIEEAKIEENIKKKSIFTRLKKLFS